MPNALPLRAAGAVREMSEGRKASSKEKPAKNKPKPSAVNHLLLGVSHNNNSALASAMMPQGNKA